jgi:hypothetical protein
MELMQRVKKQSLLAETPMQKDILQQQKVPLVMQKDYMVLPLDVVLMLKVVDIEVLISRFVVADLM